MKRPTLTRNGWVGFYHPGWREESVGCISREFPNGTIRRVFVDRVGRALMTGWFKASAY